MNGSALVSGQAEDPTETRPPTKTDEKIQAFQL